jgi:uroporphyrinogen-III synthase
VTAPLAGLTVIVARDDAPDDDLSVAIAAAGAVVVPLPLMRIVPVADPGSPHAVVDRCGPGAIVAFT